MRSFHPIFSRLLVLGAALGPLAGCPGNGGKDSDTDPSGGTTTNTTTGSSTTGSSTTDTTTDPTSEPTTSTTSEPSTGTTTVESTGGSTGEPTLGTTTDTTTGEVDPACICIDPSPIGAPSFICTATCGTLEAACEPGPGDTDTDTDGDCEFTVDEAKLACALDVLIAGDGTVRWSYTADFGFSQSGGFIQVLADRQALTRTWNREDLNIEDSNAGVVPIKSAEYFEGCKAQPTLSDKYDCLRDWTDQEPTAQCDGADFGTDF